MRGGKAGGGRAALTAACRNPGSGSHQLPRTPPKTEARCLTILSSALLIPRGGWHAVPLRGASRQLVPTQKRLVFCMAVR